MFRNAAASQCAFVLDPDDHMIEAVRDAAG
jgi:hypothetical protein